MRRRAVPVHAVCTRLPPHPLPRKLAEPRLCTEVQGGWMQSDMAKQENGRRHGNNFTFQRAARPFPQPGQPTGKRRRNASGGKGPYFLSNRGPVAFQPRPTSMPVHACLQGCQAPFPPEMYIPVNQSSANISPRFPPCTPGLHPPHGIHETPEMFPMQKEVKYQYKTLERKAGPYKSGTSRKNPTDAYRSLGRTVDCAFFM